MKSIAQRFMNCIGSALLLTVLLGLLWPGMTAQAAKSNRIAAGVTADSVDLSGLTVQEARQAIEAYMEGLADSTITLQAGNLGSASLTVRELGLTWMNEDLVEEAAAIGKKGNIVQRYKVAADLADHGQNFPMILACDDELLGRILVERCNQFNASASDASLRRENGEFIVEGGQTGVVVDYNASIDNVFAFLGSGWSGGDGVVDLAMKVSEPKASREELLQVKDVLGTFTTSYSTSGPSRRANVENGCRLIDGTILYPGEVFSTYNTVKPFSTENGYFPAGSYLNGKVVDSIGGGICQVSTTLYNAVLNAELQVTERHNHSMIVTYVDPSADAAIAESAGKDFQFANNTGHPIYIEGITGDRKITFTIYGIETRDSSHSVSYESEVLEKETPDYEEVYADASQPVGYITTSSAHVGYKAQLWKIVKENGKEVSREVINKSTYKKAPRSATVGTKTSDPNIAAQINAAIATNSIENVKAVVNNIKAAQAASQALTAEQQQAIAQAQQAAADAAAGE